MTYKGPARPRQQMANALQSVGVAKGDRVVIYLPMSIEGIVAIRACARIGATHSVVFGGFSAQSLRDRIRTPVRWPLITSDGQFRGGKALPLKPIADDALGMGGCDSIKKVLVVKRTGADVNMVAGRDVWLNDILAEQPDTCEPNGSVPSIRCSSSTPPARPASRRAFSIRRRLPAAGLAEHAIHLRHQAE